MAETFNYKYCDGSSDDVYLIKDNYMYDDNIYLGLITTIGEPAADLTVNLEPLEGPFAYIDVNNASYAETFLTENRLGKPTGTVRQSGFVIYPLYELDLERVKEVMYSNN